MAEKEDNSLFIPVDLDPSYALKTAKKLERQLNKALRGINLDSLNEEEQQIIETTQDMQSEMSEVLEKMDEFKGKKIPTKEYTNLETSIQSSQEKLAKLQEELANIKSTSFPTKEAQEYTNFIEKASARVEKLRAKAKALLEKDAEYEKLGYTVGEGHRAEVAVKWGYAEGDAQRLEKQIELAKAKLQELADAGKDVQLGDPEQESPLVDEINRLENEELPKLQSEMSKLKTWGKATMPASEGDEYAGLNSQLKDLVGKLTVSRDKVFELNQELKEARALDENDPLTKFKRNLKEIIINTSGLKIIPTIFSRLKTRTEDASKSMGRLVKKFALAAIGARSIYMVFRKVINALKEGFNNMREFAGQDTGIGQALNELSSSLQYLKNAWGASFAPLIEYVAPALSQFMDLLAGAANSVGAFFATLTGKGTIVKAIKNTDNLNDSLKGTSKSADKARGSLAAFDDLDVLDTRNDSSGGSGSGVADDVTNMFEEVEIGFDDNEFARMVKEAWENTDFTEVGLVIGTKFKEALDTAYNFISGQATIFAQKIAIDIGTLFNGFLSTEDLGNSIGKTIGGVLNLAFETINTFFETFDFASLGSVLGTSIQSAFEEFDWGQISRWSSNKLIALFDFIRGVIEGIDWSQVPKDIWDAIVEYAQGWDITGLAESFGSLLGEAISAAVEFLGASLSGIWDSLVEYFSPYVEEAGGDLVGGILLGIGNAIVNIGKWIYDHVFKPIIDAFKEHFKIGSPSKVMEEQGNFIMEGLFNGISNLIGKITELWDKLKNKIIEIWTKVKDKVSEIWDNIKTGISEKIANIKDRVVTTFTNIKEKIQNIFNTVKTFVSTIWDNIKTTISDKVTSIKEGIIEKFRTAYEKITGIFNGVKEFFAGIWDNIKSTFTTLGEKVSEAIAEPVKTAVNWIFEKIENTINGFFSLINSAIKIINKIPGVEIGTIQDVQLPRLAQGAVIPPNREFMAVLGDQKQGTNIEAPLDTIVEAFRSVVGNMEVQNTGYSEMTLDGEVFARLIVPYVVSELNRQGYNVNVLEGSV